MGRKVFQSLHIPKWETNPRELLDLSYYVRRQPFASGRRVVVTDSRAETNVKCGQGTGNNAG